MKRAVFLLVITALALSGCGIGYQKAMRTDMSGLSGQPVKVVVQKIGYPTNQLTIAGDTAYVWEKNGCTIKAGVDAQQRIVHADYDGDHSDCKSFRKMLENR
jgi:hypothetical protein